MKKTKTRIAGLAVAAALLCCPAGMAWADESVGALPGSCNISVTGTVDRTNLYYEIVLGDADASSVALSGGVTLSGVSSSSADDGLHVLIVPVTQDDEPDAWAWLSGEAASLGGDIEAYYLAFYRDDVRVEPAGAVSITLSSGAGLGQDTAVHYLDGGGQMGSVARTAADGTVSFGMDREGYYLLSAGTDEPNPPAPPSGGDDDDEPGGQRPGDGGSGDNGSGGDGSNANSGDSADDNPDAAAANDAKHGAKTGDVAPIAAALAAAIALASAAATFVTRKLAK